MQRRRRQRTSSTPAAVARFLALTHDQYYEHLREFFGTTIIALFTDEPSILGERSASDGGFAAVHDRIWWIGWRRNGRDGGEKIRRRGLPALWRDYGPQDCGVPPRLRRRRAAAVGGSVLQRTVRMVRGARDCADRSSQVEQ